MITRLLACSALASMCATLAYLTPASADATPAAATTDAVAQSPQTNPFADVPANSWAYAAVQELVNSGIITGYPDGTFKGRRPLTRYEMAIVIDKAVKAMQAQLAAGGVGSAKQTDLDALRRLVDGFGPELRDLQTQLAQLTRRADTIEKDQKALTTQVTGHSAQLTGLAKLLSQQHLGVQLWERPGTFNQNVSISQPAGAPLPAAGTASAAEGTLTGSSVLPLGNTARSVAYGGTRINLSGFFDNSFSYSVRLESLVKYNSAQTGQVGVTPNFCTAAGSALNCGVADYGGGAFGGTAGIADSLRVFSNYIQWAQPTGGFFARIGRLPLDSGANVPGIGVAGSQVNGAELGYRTSNLYAYIIGHTDGTAAYNTAVGNATLPAGMCPFGYPGNKTALPGQPAGACMTNGTDGIVGELEYTFPSKRLVLGVTTDQYNNLPYNGFNPYAGLCVTSPAGGTTSVAGPGVSTWNTNVVGVNGYCPTGSRPLVYPAGSANAGSPVTGAYQVIQTPIKTGTFYAVQFFGPRATPTWRLTAEGLLRFGNDPFSAANPASGGQPTGWQDNKGFNAELAYASKGNFFGGPLITLPGIANSNVVAIQYTSLGLHSTGVDNGIGAAIQPSASTLYGYNYHGMTDWTLSADHWFSNNFRAGINYQIFGNRGIGLPASSPTCPGCVVSGLAAREFNIDTYFTF